MMRYTNYEVVIIMAFYSAVSRAYISKDLSKQSTIMSRDPTLSIIFSKNSTQCNPTQYNQCMSPTESHMCPHVLQTSCCRSPYSCRSRWLWYKTSEYTQFQVRIMLRTTVRETVQVYMHFNLWSRV